MYTLHNVCAVHWGMFSTMGDIMSKVGNTVSTPGMFSTPGDNMSTLGAYHDECGGIS